VSIGIMNKEGFECKNQQNANKSADFLWRDCALNLWKETCLMIYLPHNSLESADHYASTQTTLSFWWWRPALIVDRTWLCCPRRIRYIRLIYV